MKISERIKAVAAFQLLIFCLFVTGCASKFVVPEGVHIEKSRMTIERADAVLFKVMQSNPASAGFCIVGNYEMMKGGEIKLKEGKARFDAYELVTIGREYSSSGSISAGTFKMITTTKFRRVPQKRVLEFSTVKQVFVHKEHGKNNICGPIPDSDYLLRFLSDQMPGNQLLVNVPPAELNAVLAAFSFYSPHVEFSEGRVFGVIFGG